MTDEDILDTRGLLCPEPVMMLHQKVRQMAVGDCVTILASDPSTQRDIPKFCTYLDHQLLAQNVEQDVYIFRVKKTHD